MWISRRAPLLCAVLALTELFGPTAQAGAGGIAGTVRAAAGGAALPGRTVQVLDEFGGFVATPTTDGVGRYFANGLAEGSYRVVALPGDDLLGQIYPGIDCTPDGCGGGLGGQLITLGAAQVVDGIDFSLLRAARIHGTITDSHSSAPIPSVRLQLFFGDGPGHLEFFGTDDLGRYRIDDLLPGVYRLTTRNFEEHVDEVWPGAPCGGYAGCDLLAGSPIALEPGEEFVADFALDPGGVIAGRVNDAAEGGPLQAQIEVWNAGGLGGTVTSEPDGRYEVRGMAAGQYRLVAEAFSDDHVAQLYLGIPCPGGGRFDGCDPATGTPIAVAAGATTAGIDFALDRRGRVSGTVTDARTGEPVEGIQILLSTLAGDFGANGLTDAEGRYTAIGLQPGQAYAVVALGFGDRYVDLLHPNLPCVGGNCDLAPGTRVQAALNQEVEGIDFALVEGGRIAGTVTRAGSAEQPSVSLALYLADGRLALVTATENGRYVLDGLPSGDYFVLAQPDFGLVYEVYDGLPCVGSGCVPTAGTPVAVTAPAETAGIDFVLDVGGAVAGEVRDAATGEPPDFLVFFELWSATGEFLTAVPAGSFFIDQLPAGSYRATTFSFYRYADQLWNGRPCPGSRCEIADGDPIAVRTGEVTEGIEFDLGPFQGLPCSEDGGRVCLQGGRFEVGMRWAAGGDSGAATGVRLTDDAAYFWFFRDDNVETFVKVHDACVPPFQRFWVFAAGLTNVATELEVLDTWTGVTYRHETAQGPAYQPLLDTGAFATCAAPPPSPAAAAAASPAPARLQPVLELLRQRPPDAAVKSSPAGAGAAGGACVAGPTRLCLAGGRFAVEATWQTAQGDGGAAQAEPLTADTGTFWFFQPENVELLVKVLDACVPPHDRFWVFAAGLTNLEVTLRVTDTASGRIHEYRNPRGQAFIPVQDTSTFDTCP